MKQTESITYNDSKMTDIYYKRPRYLAALTANNSPRKDWGPMKRINQYGIYVHLSIDSTSSNNILAEHQEQQLSPVGRSTVRNHDEGDESKF